MKAKVVGFDSESQWVKLQWSDPLPPEIVIGDTWLIGNMKAKCRWSEDEDGNWETGCREMFIVLDGKPSENKMEFCCYCGKPIEEVKR